MLRAFAVLVTLCFLPVRVSAQDVVTGAVIDSNRIPLGQAWVNVVGTGSWALTADDGAFHLASVPLGKHKLEVRRIGYVPASIPIVIEPEKILRIDVTMISAPVPLDPLSVEAEERPVHLKGFEERKARGWGTFFTRDQIVRMQPRVFTDVLRRVPGMQVMSDIGVYGSNPSPRSNRATGISGPRPCPVLFYLDGTPFPITGDVPINNFVAAEEIAAVEVYNGVSQIPPQFLSSALNARCGVIVMWTVSGRRNGPPG